MKSLAEKLEDYDVAKNAFISGLIFGWAESLSIANYEERFRVIKDMKEFSERLGKSAGVTIGKNEKSP